MELKIEHVFFLCVFMDNFNRFRHLDATMRLTPSRRNSATGGGSSPSPENENCNSITLCRSPKRSPVLQRKRGTSPNPNGNANANANK